MKFALLSRKGWSHLVFTSNRWRCESLPIWRPENWAKLMDALLVRPKMHFNGLLHPLLVEIRSFHFSQEISSIRINLGNSLRIFLSECRSWIIYLWSPLNSSQFIFWQELWLVFWAPFTCRPERKNLIKVKLPKSNPPPSVKKKPDGTKGSPI